jgi:hypothetical protein
MANHALPTLESLWADFLRDIDEILKDNSVQFNPALTSTANLPLGTIRWNPDAKRWESWDGQNHVALSDLYAINISGNAATADTFKGFPRINGVVFNGSKSVIVRASTEAEITVTSTELGDPSGTTFNGNLPLLIGHNSVGAPRFDGVGASGTWGIDISGRAALATVANAVDTTIAAATVATTKPEKTSDNTVATTAFVDRLRSLLSTSPKGAALAEDRGCLLHLIANLTINPNVFESGDVFVLYNNTNSTLAVVAGAGGTQRQAGTTLVGSRSLLPRALVTVTFVSPSEWLLSGAGLA